MKGKIAIVGASYLQTPLIKKAKVMDLETHVFAWVDGAEGAQYADYFYPISIIEKEAILEKCRNIRPDGIVSIASDLAVPTVNYVADQMGLVGNSIWSSLVSTNKYEMRRTLSASGLPCPYFTVVNASNLGQLDPGKLKFPVIVKPTDRSGSRGVTKVDKIQDLSEALSRATSHSLSREAIIEDFVYGKEVSVESISFEGKHYMLAITDKITTGAPNFVELGHSQPSSFSLTHGTIIKELVQKALDALGIKNGASHAELIITDNDDIMIVEIGARMGGDFIGSHLVELSTGYDFVKGVIDVCLGRFSCPSCLGISKYSGIRYLCPEPGNVVNIEISNIPPEIMEYKVICNIGDKVMPLKDSSNRVAYFIYQSEKEFKVEKEFIKITTESCTDFGDR